MMQSINILSKSSDQICSVPNKLIQLCFQIIIVVIIGFIGFIAVSCEATTGRVPADPAYPGTIDQDGNLIQEFVPNEVPWGSISYTTNNYNFDGNIAALNAEIIADITIETASIKYTWISNPATANSGQLDTTQIEGIVTMSSNWYFKPKVPPYGGVYERNYGCFFIQDMNAGILVLNEWDAIPVFKIGDRVKLTVLSAARNYDYNYIVGYAFDPETDLVSRDNPIYYQAPLDTCDATGSSDNAAYPTPYLQYCEDQVNMVIRVTGTINLDPSKPTVLDQYNNFGEFFIWSDATGMNYACSLSIDMKDRRFSIEHGERYEVTGPMYYSYSLHKICLSSEAQLIRIP